MKISISRCVADVIHAEAEDAPNSEVCGLLFGTPGTIVGHVRCRNVASDPADGFEIDPQALIAAHRRARAGGPAIIGCYHSHPSGRACPSERDAHSAAPNGWLWLIVAAGQLGCYRAVAGGRYYDRFDEVAFDLWPVAAP